MSDQVWIVLAVAAAVVIVLVTFRDRLRHFAMKVSNRGFDVRLEGRPREAASTAPGSIVIRGSRQSGWKNLISIWRPGVVVEDATLQGARNQLVVGPDPVPNGVRRPIGEKNQ